MVRIIFILSKSEEKGLFPPFSGFPRCSSHPPEKSEKGRKRAKKANCGRFPGRAARHPLSPGFGPISGLPKKGRFESKNSYFSTGLSGPISRDVCDTIAAKPHISRYSFKGGYHSPEMVRYPPMHIRAIPHFATCRAIIVRDPIKTSTSEFCDTIATSIARYEKYRCWASKLQGTPVGKW